MVWSVFVLVVALGAGVPILAGSQAYADDGVGKDHTTAGCPFSMVD